VIVIARLTVFELFRRRIVWVLAGLTIVSVLLVAFGVERLVTLARADGVGELEIRIGVSQVLILIAFMFSFVLAMTAAFLGAPAVGADIESGVALALLARPLRRVDLLLGRWLGLAVAVVGYTIASGALAIIVVSLISGFGPPEPVLAIAFLAAQALVLLTLTLALGTVMPAIGAGAIAVVAYGIGWMAGVMAGIAAAFDITSLAAVAEASRWVLPSDGLWRGVVYGLEPPLAALIADGRVGRGLEANPFYAIDPPPLPFLIWSVAWIAIVLALAAWRLSRRDL
jgi:ABC-2 type transport system permease protein